MDPAKGWMFTDASMTTIVFTGSICDQVLSGKIHDVRIAFLCTVN